MSVQTLFPALRPAIRAADHFHELARVHEQELLMAQLRLDEAEAAALRALGVLEQRRGGADLHGVASDEDVARVAQAETVYATRRALASLRNRGLVDSCIGCLRWVLTDDGRAALAAIGGAR